jgi:undecaprenyl-diphosphatase
MILEHRCDGSRRPDQNPAVEGRHVDRSVFFFINHGWANPVLDRVFVWISTWWGFGLPLGVLMLIVFRRRWERQGMLLWIVLVLLLSFGETGGRLIKHVTLQPRPCLEMAGEVRQPDLSRPGPCKNGRGGMPSNHALDYFAAATFIATAFRSRRWALVGFAVAVLASLSRVYLGKHYPSQVMAGAAIGIVWGLLVARLAQRRLRLFDAAADLHPRRRAAIGR